MADEFGLPGMTALDSPYGLRTQPVLRVPVLQALAMPPIPNFARPMAQQGSVAAASPVPKTRSVLPPQISNVTPIREQTTGAAGAVNFPVAGKNLSLEQFTDLQRRAESSGNYQALNREAKGNTASGAYQYTDGTWNNYGGYPKALLAPRAVQDRRFAEDIAQRVRRYNGDLFKAAASHYLPAYAGNPRSWNEPVKLRTKTGYVTVSPIAGYLKKVFKGTPYADQLEAYINAHQ